MAYGNYYLKIANFFYNCAYFWFSLAPLACGALEFLISTPVSILLMLGIYGIKAYIDCYLYKDFPGNTRSANKKLKRISLFALCWCIIMPLFMYKTCLSFY